MTQEAKWTLIYIYICRGFGVTNLQSLDRDKYSCIKLTRFLTHWCKFLAAVQPKSAATQITTLVIILVLGCSELEIKYHYATHRVLAERAEWHRTLSDFIQSTYSTVRGLDWYWTIIWDQILISHCHTPLIWLRFQPVKIVMKSAFISNLNSFNCILFWKWSLSSKV